MRTYTGSPWQRLDPEMREALAPMDRFLREISPAFARLAAGRVPEGSGLTIGSPVAGVSVAQTAMPNYLYLPDAEGATQTVKGDVVFEGSVTFSNAAITTVIDDLFYIVDATDNTKQATFVCAAISTGTLRAYTFPDADGTLVLRDSANTFTRGLTIDNNFVYPGDVLLKLVPDASQSADILQVRDAGDTSSVLSVSSAGMLTATVAPKIDIASAATNYVWTAQDNDGNGAWAAVPATTVDAIRTWSTLQTFKDTTFKLVDDGDATKTAAFSLGGASAGADLTLAWSGTADGTVTIPNATTTLAGLAVGQTFTKPQVIDNDTASDVLLKLVPHASQSADILQVRNSGDSASGMKIDNGANLHLGATISTAASLNIAADASGGAAYISFQETSAGFGATFELSAALTASRIYTLPDATGNVLLSTSNTSLTFSLRSSTASSGTSFFDTTTNTKRLRVILSGAVGNNAFTIANTAARTYTFGDKSGNVLLDTSGIALLGSATIDMKTAATTTIYTTAAGVVTRITHAVVRDPTATLLGGLSYTITGLRAAFSLTTLITANTGFLVVRALDGVEQAEVAASTAVQLTVTTGSTGAANATIDVFGYVV